MLDIRPSISLYIGNQGTFFFCDLLDRRCRDFACRETDCFKTKMFVYTRQKNRLLKLLGLEYACAWVWLLMESRVVFHPNKSAFISSSSFTEWQIPQDHLEPIFRCFAVFRVTIFGFIVFTCCVSFLPSRWRPMCLPWRANSWSRYGWCVSNQIADVTIWPSSMAVYMYL